MYIANYIIILFISNTYINMQFICIILYTSLYILYIYWNIYLHIFLIYIIPYVYNGIIHIYMYFMNFELLKSKRSLRAYISSPDSNIGPRKCNLRNCCFSK